MTNAVSAKGNSNLDSVFNDCAKTPGGNVRYIEPDPAKVNQGRIIRDESAVKRAQEALGVKSDGMWGNKTTLAAQQRIEQFQKEKGLEVTGKYSAETAEAMKKDPASRGLGEALDGMRNRDLLNRVYKPLEKESADVDCRRPGAQSSTTGPVQKDRSIGNREERSIGNKDNSIANADRSIANRDTRSIGNKENSIGNADRSIANRDARSIGNKDNSIDNADRSIANRDTRSIGNKENSIGNADRSIGNRDVRSIGNRENSIGNVENSIGNAGPAIVGAQTGVYVQPVAVYTKDAKGNFTEAPKGSLHNGKPYDPELGGLVTPHTDVSSLDTKKFIESMRQGGISMGSIDPSAPPKAAVPAAPAREVELNTFKP